jgi:L,D-peptidoglycan transpeptidase YkuD (ErfK/YbiS/YcfS/YnhG family)
MLVAPLSAAHADDASATFTSWKSKISDSSQVLLVTNDCPSSVSVKITILEKNDRKWTKVRAPMKGVIGKNGFAKYNEKREGDGCTPSGVFSLQRTFGYGDSIRSKMPYRQILSDDLWIDDSNAADYNRLVKKAETRALSFEIMKRDDNLYKYGIIIEYNTDPVIKGRGSAIFIHIWRGENVPTAGCVAVSEKNMIKILEILNPKAKPLIIMGTENQIERLTE